MLILAEVAVLSFARRCLRVYAIAKKAPVSFERPAVRLLPMMFRVDDACVLDFGWRPYRLYVCLLFIYFFQFEGSGSGGRG